jgi:trehalose-phosphatase
MHAPVPIADLPSALEHLDEVWEAVGGAAPVVALDYDGTLTPIVAHADDAVLDDGVRQLLRDLAAHVPVIIVSGRDRADVEAKVGEPGLWYAGSHGCDISGPGGFRFEHRGALDALPSLDDAARRLEEVAAASPGAWVERKRFAVALHVRQASPDAVPALLERGAAVASAFPTLRPSTGKMVVEVRPAIDWHKGAALRFLLDEALPAPHGRPLFVGDDLTDEDAFAAVAADGAGIVVAGGDHATLARWSLAGPDEVRVLLGRLRDRLGGST